MKVSIIVPAYNQTRLSAHLTMLCLANITKYTNVEDYELILIEDIPKFDVRDDYKVLKIDKHIILDEYTNYSTKMNMGAKQAKYDILAFIQNDCFVWEGWLGTLRYYLEKDLVDCIIPDQFPRERKFVLDSYKDSLDEGLGKGAPDACMMMMTRRAFEKSGGFNDKLQVLVEGDFYKRMGETGVRYSSTNKCMVSHVTLGTHYQDWGEFEKKLDNDSRI